MRIGTIGKHTIRLDEEDYKTLLVRFDLSKAEHSFVSIARTTAKEQWTIKQPCLCEYYKDDCEECPLEDKCSSFARRITEAYAAHKKMAIELESDCVHWDSEDDTQARKEIQNIRDWLEGMTIEDEEAPCSD